MKRGRGNSEEMTRTHSIHFILIFIIHLILKFNIKQKNFSSHQQTHDSIDLVEIVHF